MHSAALRERLQPHPHALCGTARTFSFVLLKKRLVLRLEVLLGRVDAERHTQARSVPHVDITIFDDLVRQPVDDVVPPW